jgi:hypothetical protein
MVTTDTSTVSEFLDRWLDRISPSKSTTTILGYRGKVRRINEKIDNVAAVEAHRSAFRPDIPRVA